MANIVVIGAGLGGLPAAYELHKLLGKDHNITVVSKAPKFVFTPSLP
jgi:sulfide:quinone oxidoreductase